MSKAAYKRPPGPKPEKKIHHRDTEAQSPDTEPTLEQLTALLARLGAPLDELALHLKLGNEARMQVMKLQALIRCPVEDLIRALSRGDVSLTFHNPHVPEGERGALTVSSRSRLAEGGDS